MEKVKKVLVIYYDVKRGNYNVYNKIYKGYTIDSAGKKEFIPGLKSKAICALPINKSVWIALVETAPMVEKLRKAVTGNGTYFDYVEAVIPEGGFEKVWERYKIMFVLRMQKLLDETRAKVEKGLVQAKDVAVKILNEELEYIQGLIMAFGLGYEDTAEGRENIISSIQKVLNEVQVLQPKGVTGNVVNS